MPPRFDFGFVSGSRAMVDFLVEVFQLEELAPIVLDRGTVHRLQLQTSVIKVMVPTEPPAPLTRAHPFWAIAGLRYATVWVDDLDAVIERAVGAGGRLVEGPSVLVPGSRYALLEDPDGNALELAWRET